MSISSTLLSLPHAPGVYIYKNSEKTIIYIGKAIDLSRRVKQYFQRDDAVGEKTPRLVAEIASIETIETSSEFEALLLEAKLIKQYQPKYNVISKDDKSPLYIIIDFSQELPTITLGRKYKTLESTALFFGPFQSSTVVKGLMRSLRRVVPYCSQKVRNGKKCFYTHLGLCNPCPSYISKLVASSERDELTKHYRSNLFRLRDILSGKAVTVIKEMERDMEQRANREQFEEAASIRNQITALRSLLSKKYDPQVYIQSDTMIDELFEKEQLELIKALKPYYPRLNDVRRIECYDISNTQGTNPTASMVVLTQGRIDKTEYKKFRIKTVKGPNDFAMMQEVLSRRFTHLEWQLPDLIVIDGGKGQVSVAKEKIPFQIPVIGLAKREEEIIVPHNDEWKIIRLPFSSGGLKMLQRLRDEAHRFAITYHKHLRAKGLT